MKKKRKNRFSKVKIEKILRMVSKIIKKRPE